MPEFPLKRMLPAVLILLFATIVLYFPVASFEFIRFDDDQYVVNNPFVKNGPSIEGLRKAVTETYAANWHPLTWASHMVDCGIFGLKHPGGHHLTNLLFHAANTVLLFFVLYAMTRAVWRSFFVAALFALHPLHIESVAWVAERKDVLSGFFWMLTLWLYYLYVRKPSAVRFLWVCVVFALGLGEQADGGDASVRAPFARLLASEAVRRRSGRSFAYAVQKKARFLDRREMAPVCPVRGVLRHHYIFAGENGRHRVVGICASRRSAAECRGRLRRLSG